MVCARQHQYSSLFSKVETDVFTPCVSTYLLFSLDSHGESFQAYPLHWTGGSEGLRMRLEICIIYTFIMHYRIT